MNNFQLLNHDHVVTRIYAEEMLMAFHEQMREAERLADELNDLLTNFQTALEHEGMRGEVKTLSRWAERYRHGLLAADKISQNGRTWLETLNNRLNLEIKALGRLEDEGGHIFHNRPRDVEMGDFVTAAQQVGALASRIEHMFGRPATGVSHARQ